MIGNGSITKTLTPSEVQQLVATALDPMALEGKRVLVIIPDSTRTAPIPLMFRLLYDQIGKRVTRLDYLIALGTHPQMSESAIDKLVGVSRRERQENFPNTEIFNHRWDSADQLHTIGTIPGDEIARITNNLICDPVPVRLNRLITNYDLLLICGPVFPHEVIGFSGGAKYLFPGIAGAEIINATHWLGALATSMHTIGVKETPVRRVVHRAAEFIKTPVVCITMVLKGDDLHGMYIGSYLESFNAAADLSATLNIITVPNAFKRVLSMPSERYDDLWTAAKAMYKTEPAIAEGGEVIIYAPHISEVSYTHGALIDRVGYHVRDYFVKQSERFADVPGAIKAHSTHVKGSGEYDAGSKKESPRIQVTLATQIPEERCRLINLGFADYRGINPGEWKNQEKEGVLLVEHAGEMLYRAQDLKRT
jgi:nickel-dependent lactate racemase